VNFEKIPNQLPAMEKKEVKEMSPEESYSRMDDLIEELQNSSKFKERKVLDDGREVIRSPEAGEFFIRRVQDTNDPAVQKIHEFLVKEFSKEEADTLETVKAAVEQEVQVYRIAENAEGRIVALGNMQYLELESSQEAMLFAAYVVTDADYRKAGLGSELYPGFYNFAKEKAKKDGVCIKGIIGEAVDTVESFLNRMGRKRIYFEDENGNIREVPYVQAPLDWDKKTGEPKTKAVAEHLMIRLLDGRQEMQISEIMPMVKAIYEENYTFAEEYFKTKKAYQACEDTVMSHLSELENVLQKAKDGKLFLMDKAEREKKQKEIETQGKQIFEWGKSKAEESEKE
jgi:predicted N-acetyltransferase YhbS